MSLLEGEYFAAENKTFVMGESDNYKTLSQERINSTWGPGLI